MSGVDSKYNLQSHIRNIIAMDGAIPLDYFLSLVIPYYYQNNNALGGYGDFITAPEASQMFGEIIGVWAVQRWIEGGRLGLELIELGPGNGLLMFDLLRATKHIDGFHAAIKKIHLVEISQELRNKQKKHIAQFNIPICWHENLDTIVQGKTYILVANEFFDALPIKQFIYKNNRFYEVYVGIRDDKLELQLKNTPSLPFENLHTLQEEQVLEISPTLLYYTSKIASLLGKYGSALVIDYGYLISPKTNTLQAIKDHKHIPILDHIGEADITSLVDFSCLIREIEQCSLKANLYSQSEFLITQGIYERAKQLVQKGANPKKIERQLELLVGENKMGQLFKVLEVM